MAAADERFTDADEIFHGEMPSILDHRENLIRQILEALKESGYVPDDPYFEHLWLDEALINAVVHGNREDPAKKVKVRAFRKDDRWAVEITDEGEGFDWRAVRARVEQDLPSTEASGRGVALILATGADVQFLDGGRRMLVVRES